MDLIPPTLMAALRSPASRQPAFIPLDQRITTLLQAAGDGVTLMRAAEILGISPSELLPYLTAQSMLQGNRYFAKPEASHDQK